MYAAGFENPGLTLFLRRVAGEYKICSCISSSQSTICKTKQNIYILGKIAFSEWGKHAKHIELWNA